MRWVKQKWNETFNGQITETQLNIIHNAFVSDHYRHQVEFEAKIAKIESKCKDEIEDLKKQVKKFKSENEQLKNLREKQNKLENKKKTYAAVVANKEDKKSMVKL